MSPTLPARPPGPWYEITELDSRIQNRLRDRAAEFASQDWESAWSLERVIEQGAAAGFTLALGDIHWRGFCSQGDGLSFRATIDLDHPAIRALAQQVTIPSSALMPVLQDDDPGVRALGLALTGAGHVGPLLDPDHLDPLEARYEIWISRAHSRSVHSRVMEVNGDAEDGRIPTIPVLGAALKEFETRVLDAARAIADDGYRQLESDYEADVEYAITSRLEECWYDADGHELGTKDDLGDRPSTALVSDPDTPASSIAPAPAARPRRR